MDFNTYQTAALLTDVADINEIPEAKRAELLNLSRLVLGLVDESGESAAALKKHLRGDYDYAELRRRLLKELGDVLWYVSQVAVALGLRLDDIAEVNLAKLSARHAEGTIRGDGDER